MPDFQPRADCRAGRRLDIPCIGGVDGASFISVTCARAGIVTKAMLAARNFFIRYSLITLFLVETNLTCPGNIIFGYVWLRTEA